MKNNPLGIRGVDHFSIPCRDAEKSLTFYETILGATVYEDDLGPYRFGFSAEDKALGREPHIFLEIGGQRVELLGRDPDRTAPFGTHHAFAIGPNDVQAVVAHLEAHGVPYNGPATHRGTHAVSVYFQDPDGNELELTCWDNYPRMDEIPLWQRTERRDTRLDWDPVARRGRPAVASPA